MAAGMEDVQRLSESSRTRRHCLEEEMAMVKFGSFGKGIKELFLIRGPAE